VLELAGIKDVLTKVYGSTSPKNLVKATIDGLQKLRSRARVEELRGVTLDLPPERPPKKAPIEAYVSADEPSDEGEADSGQATPQQQQEMQP
jgi:hypothetical protein